MAPILLIYSRKVQYFKLFSIYNSNIVFQKCVTTKQCICKCTWNFKVTNIYFNFFSARPLRGAGPPGPPWLRHCVHVVIRSVAFIGTQQIFVDDTPTDRVEPASQQRKLMTFERCGEQMMRLLRCRAVSQSVTCDVCSRRLSHN